MHNSNSPVGFLDDISPRTLAAPISASMNDAQSVTGELLVESPPDRGQVMPAIHSYVVEATSLLPASIDSLFILEQCNNRYCTYSAVPYRTNVQ